MVPLSHFRFDTVLLNLELDPLSVDESLLVIEFSSHLSLPFDIIRTVCGIGL